MTKLRFENHNTVNENHTGNRLENREKNRVSLIVPSDHFRPRLKIMPGHSEYINAICLNSYRNKYKTKIYLFVL